MELIAARVPELPADVLDDLAIACEQAMPKPKLLKRVGEKLKSMKRREKKRDVAFDTSGYYPVRRAA